MRSQPRYRPDSMFRRVDTQLITYLTYFSVDYCTMVNYSRARPRSYLPTYLGTHSSPPTAPSKCPTTQPGQLTNKRTNQPSGTLTEANPYQIPKQPNPRSVQPRQRQQRTYASTPFTPDPRNHPRPSAKPSPCACAPRRREKPSTHDSALSVALPLSLLLGRGKFLVFLLLLSSSSLFSG